MNRLTALRLLERMQDENPERLPAPPEAWDAPQTPLSLASIACLTGMLDDVADDDIDCLIKVCESGLDYIHAGILNLDQWESEVLDLCSEKLRSIEGCN